MRQTLLLLLLLLGFAVGAQAQEKITARGVVVDSEGEPLIGVIIRGSIAATRTNNDGEYQLACLSGETLSFSYLGFKPMKLKAGEKRQRVVMTEDVKQLNQVVVNGYTQTDIRKSTGSVGTLTEKDLKDQPLAGVDMLMQGKLTGVNIQAVSGRPGQSAKIRIRGIASITGNSDPLWVVDGVPITKEIPVGGSTYVRSGDFTRLYADGIAGIAPQDIESITVLKDAAAAAIYGSQASAGVIVVTTKRGKAGNMRVNYSGTVSVQTAPSRDHNLMNTQEKLAYEQSVWDEFSAKGYANGTYFPRIGIVGQVRGGYGRFAGMSKAEQDAYLSELSRTNTDWFQELMRNTTSTSQHLSLSGGSDKLVYYVSGGLNTNKGIVKRTSSDGYNFSTKLTATPNNKLKINFSADYSYLKSLGSSANFDIFRYAYYANPYEKPYNADGSYAADNTYFSLSMANNGTTKILPAGGVNVMREINETTAMSNSSSTTLRGDITWRITDNLRIYGLASYTNSSDQSENELGQNTYAAWEDRVFEGSSFTSRRVYGSLTQNSNTNRSWLARAQINYSNTFNGAHYISALFGSEVRNNFAKSVFRKVYGYDPVTGNHSTPLLLTSSTMDMTTALQQYQNILNSLTGQTRTESAFASFYGAFDYAYRGRYVANVTARTDGSNNFGSNEQFNFTWSTGLGWNIDEEAFMQNLKPILSRATLRLSTGLTGGVNKSVSPVLIMRYLSTYRNNDTQAFRTGTISSPPNPYLRWERTRDWNASLDMGFLNNRLGLNISYYHRRGYDLVTSSRVPSSTGFVSQSYNTSEQVNKGVEIMLNATPIIKGDWRWSLSGNISYNSNKLTKYDPPSGTMYGSFYVGYPQGKLFTGKPAGIDPATGLYTFQLRPDADRNDLYSNYNYLFYIGTTNYPWTGGFSTNLSWKNLSLSLSTSFSLGAWVSNKISNNPQASYSAIFKTITNRVASEDYDAYAAHLNGSRDRMRRWTPDNPITDAYPRLIDAFGEDLGLNNSQVSFEEIVNSVYMEKVNYWKIGSISLTYSLPEKLLRNKVVQSAGFSFTANNLFYITNYSGMNPESPGAVYPQSRSFSFGVNVGF